MIFTVRNLNKFKLNNKFHSPNTLLKLIPSPERNTNLLNKWTTIMKKLHVAYLLVLMEKLQKR